MTVPYSIDKVLFAILINISRVDIATVFSRYLAASHDCFFATVACNKFVHDGILHL